jgi:hypothetical protein
METSGRARLGGMIGMTLMMMWSFSTESAAQQADSLRGRKHVTVTPGPQYAAPPLHQKLWGKHYRTEWTTPVQVPVFYLDAEAGGLKPYRSGGGNQSKTLHLRDSRGREYVLRSIDKNYGKALPEMYSNTFVERRMNDQVSAGHPFAALTIPIMADAAKIYHTRPRIVYVPQQPALDSFGKQFGNALYLFEERADDNREDAPNFGNSKNIIGTSKLIERIYEDPSHRVDQSSFIRARLFDMFVGDWGRHEDQWRWASFEQNGITLYKPIPRDRDQTYTKFDGVLTGLGTSAAGLGHIESFDHKIKDIARYNYPARNLDRRMANETTLEQWTATAKELQGLLTDKIIETALKQMPPEMFAVSGSEIIAKLKSRRHSLVNFARDYYHSLAKEVEVPGTKEREVFVVKQGDNSTSVQVFAVDSNGRQSVQPFYSRDFREEETKELRLFGLGGEDAYEVQGKENGIRLRIIGGPATDVYRVESSAGVHVYETQQDLDREGIRPHISNNTELPRFRYDGFSYDKKGLSPIIFYGSDDRLFAGLGYRFLNHKWGKEPYASKHSLNARYSITQGGFNVFYEGDVNQFIGKWNLALAAGYDHVVWNNFFGVGNETPPQVGDNDYYRLRSRDYGASVGLNRRTGPFSVGFTGFYQSVGLINDPERFVAKVVSFHQPDFWDRRHFAGGRLDLAVQKMDNPVIPTRGFRLAGNISRTQNLTDEDRDFTRYSAAADIFIPLSRKLVLASRLGASTVDGDPLFYQFPSIGGSQTLRGYRRDRFYGKTAFYNSNELRWLFDYKSRLFNGTVGLMALYDQGRVWQPGEVSSQWHSGYGAGILVAPFNRVLLTLSYGRSDERGVIHVGYVKPF